MAKSKRGELVPAQQSQDLQSLVDLGKQALVTLSEQGTAQSQLAHQQLRFAEKRLDFEKSAFKYKAVLVGALTVGVLAISSGLIFGQNNLSAGLSVLSHIGALISGAFAGWGWERGRKSHA